MTNTNDVDPAPVHDLVGELRDLIHRGTSGPWEAHARPWRCNGKPMDEWNIRTTWIQGQLKDKMGVVARSLNFSDDEKDRHGVWLDKKDADLIVAAVNALPALLAITEAAAVVLSKRNGPYLMADMDATLKAESDLRTALRLLPNAQDHRAAKPLRCINLLDSE